MYDSIIKLEIFILIHLLLNIYSIDIIKSENKMFNLNDPFLKKIINVKKYFFRDYTCCIFLYVVLYINYLDIRILVEKFINTIVFNI